MNHTDQIIEKLRTQLISKDQATVQFAFQLIKELGLPESLKYLMTNSLFKIHLCFQYDLVGQLNVPILKYLNTLDTSSLSYQGTLVQRNVVEVLSQLENASFYKALHPKIKRRLFSLSIELLGYLHRYNQGDYTLDFKNLKTPLFTISQNVENIDITLLYLAKNKHAEKLKSEIDLINDKIRNKYRIKHFFIEALKGINHHPSFSLLYIARKSDEALIFDSFEVDENKSLVYFQVKLKKLYK
jgi:hypothetical protein